MVYSSANRITMDMIMRTKYAKHPVLRFCAGAWGTQSDCQSLGYDSLCALAALLYVDCSYKAVTAAQKEVQDSPYSKGFHDGWDRKDAKQNDEEYKLGHADGLAITNQFGWSRSNPNDGSYR